MSPVSRFGAPSEHRTLRHVVEVPASGDDSDDRLAEMQQWCADRFGGRGWTRASRLDGGHRYAQFRFAAPAMADQFAERFRAACPVRCRR